jgi:hypothetical protein
MTQYQKPATNYKTVAASQTTATIGPVGSYLESVTIIPATTAGGGVTILDGTVAIVTIPTAAHGSQSAPYKVDLGIYSKSTSEVGFKITTGSCVSVIAVGRFS